MKILFYFGHPAQYLFLRAAISVLLKNGHSAVVLIKSKDVLENLIKSDGVPYKNILPKKRGKSKFAVLTSLIKRIVLIFPILRKEKPDLLIGTDAPIAILGRILSIRRITITEDDYDVVKSLAKLTYPHTETILCPKICDVGKYNSKKIGYEGYMKLGYLHPEIFQANKQVLSKYKLISPFILIRLARLTAHHDFGIKGITEETLEQIINICSEKNFSVYISSESELNKKFQSYLLQIDPSDIHHILSQATLFISDSQSMSVESAMLGTPSIRFSSFAGKISVLEELEHKYKLTFGVDPSESDTLFSLLLELLDEKNIGQAFNTRRDIMLNDKINVTRFLVWFIENYPESIKIMKNNPEYQTNFF